MGILRKDSAVQGERIAITRHRWHRSCRKSSSADELPSTPNRRLPHVAPDMARRKPHTARERERREDVRQGLG